MNAPIIDPLQGDFPEVIEEYLQHGNMKCISFNRRGTLLAAGCADGSCVIWDFETRGVAKELRDKACIAPITSVCWSKLGHYVLASATDKSLTLWNILTGEKITRVTLQQTTLHACLHPGSCTPSLCLACPLSSAPILVDLNNGSSTVLPVSVSDTGNGSAIPHPRNKFSDGSPPFTPTAATFNKYGDLIYLGNSKGEILIVDSKSIKVNAVIPIPGNSVVKDIVFSRNGQYLLTNSNDRVIRVYENLLPKKGAAKELETMTDADNADFSRIDKLKEAGTKCLCLSREFQDAVTRIQWKAPCFSGDGEWVIGASASKGEHKLYIWDRAGHLVKILEGPKEALIGLAWHPLRPLVVSVSVAGLVYIWAKDYMENWSAFAPDFKELEENEEYIEREDEFDLMPESEKVKELDINQDEEVDILTVEKDSSFSDSDASEDELIFLPVTPLPDVPEQLDKCLGSSLKLEDSNHTSSPFSVEAAQNGQTILPASSPLEVIGNSTPEDAAGTGGSKRKRKPSAKGMELQAEKGRKPSTKKGKLSSGKSSKFRNKNGDRIEANGTVLDEYTEDDVTDDYL
ncbi:protein RBL-like [Zingiber officinale]|uniref:protein RBL-like n=1 Tax=Zingiber officinale TaxID=94328 RepID=UPI001C4D4AB5|nr:protein RBL-like [Zingiber officinale]XP_042443296.1 protein RBL-like [Zingiber officinale]